jgi:hypothetical protein
LLQQVKVGLFQTVPAFSSSQMTKYQGGKRDMYVSLPKPFTPVGGVAGVNVRDTAPDGNCWARAFGYQYVKEGRKLPLEVQNRLTDITFGQQFREESDLLHNAFKAQEGINVSDCSQDKDFVIIMTIRYGLANYLDKNLLELVPNDSSGITWYNWIDHALKLVNGSDKIGSVDQVSALSDVHSLCCPHFMTLYLSDFLHPSIYNSTSRASKPGAWMRMM